jgi:predicted metal-dependent hydrolase
MGVKYERIAIKFQKTRFGSCSTKKNLNFNALVALMPSEILDYVIVHELSHLNQMNHSKAFWQEVEKIIPDYKKKRKWLKDNGVKYMQLI